MQQRRAAGNRLLRSRIAGCPQVDRAESRHSVLVLRMVLLGGAERCQTKGKE
jgi:hypothetical protein